MESILQAIDQEISRLQQVRKLLAQNTGSASYTTTAVKAPAKQSRGRRQMSAEGRARIAEAQRKRWAARKKGKK